MSNILDLALAANISEPEAVAEAEYQLLLAHDLGFINDENYTSLHNQVEEVKRMLASFLKTLRS